MADTKGPNVTAFEAEVDGNSLAPGRTSHSMGGNSQQDSQTVFRSGDSMQSDDTKVVYPPFAKAMLILTGLFMGVFLVALDQTIIGTAIPKITDEYNTIQVSY